MSDAVCTPGREPRSVDASLSLKQATGRDTTFDRNAALTLYALTVI